MRLTVLAVFQYDLCLLTFDHNLSFAPFTKLNRVLDVGCGVGECGRTSRIWHSVAADIPSGYWALDFGEFMNISRAQPYTNPHTSQLRCTQKLR